MTDQLVMHPWLTALPSAPRLHSLAAAGWGWGGRMKFAVMHGCIPVIVQVGGLDVLGAGDLGAAN